MFHPPKEHRNEDKGAVQLTWVVCHPCKENIRIKLWQDFATEEEDTSFAKECALRAGDEVCFHVHNQRVLQKCPFSKWDITSQDACKDTNFCSLVDGRLHLNRTHPYYLKFSYNCTLALICIHGVTFVFSQLRVSLSRGYFLIPCGTQHMSLN